MILFFDGLGWGTPQSSKMRTWMSERKNSSFMLHMFCLWIWLCIFMLLVLCH